MKTLRNTSLVLRAIREASQPLTIDDIIKRVSAWQPLSARDPRAAVRQAISNVKQIASLGDGTYGWLPALLTGCTLRIALRGREVDEQRLLWGEEMKAAGWPGFFDRDLGDNGQPLQVDLPDGQTAIWKYVAFGDRQWGTTLDPVFSAWLTEVAREPGALIVTVVDGPGRRVAVRFEPRAARDDAQVLARNRELVAAILDFMRSTTQNPSDYDLTRRVLARGAYRHPVPPDPLSDVWNVDALGDDAPERAFAYFLHGLDARLITSLVSERERRFPRQPQLPAPGWLADPRATNGQIFRLGVVLVESDPPLWRRLEVPADLALTRLHDILQLALGWTNSHLHAFVCHGEYFRVPGPDDLENEHDARRYRLNALLALPGDTLTYLYDFGDNWRHQVTLESIAAPEAGRVYPRCVAGARACPPEDVGGVWGYAEFLEALADPEHPEHEAYRTWAPYGFAPERFDLARVNAGLRVWARVPGSLA